MGHNDGRLAASNKRMTSRFETMPDSRAATFETAKYKQVNFNADERVCDAHCFCGYCNFTPSFLSFSQMCLRSFLSLPPTAATDTSGSGFCTILALATPVIFPLNTSFAIFLIWLHLCTFEASHFQPSTFTSATRSKHLLFGWRVDRLLFVSLRLDIQVANVLLLLPSCRLHRLELCSLVHRTCSRLMQNQLQRESQDLTSAFMKSQQTLTTTMLLLLPVIRFVFGLRVLCSLSPSAC